MRRRGRGGEGEGWGCVGGGGQSQPAVPIVHPPCPPRPRLRPRVMWWGGVGWGAMGWGGARPQRCAHRAHRGHARGARGIARGRRRGRNRGRQGCEWGRVGSSRRRSGTAAAALSSPQQQHPASAWREPSWNEGRGRGALQGLQRVWVPSVSSEIGYAQDGRNIGRSMGPQRLQRYVEDAKKFEFEFERPRKGGERVPCSR